MTNRLLRHPVDRWAVLLIASTFAGLLFLYFYVAPRSILWCLIGSIALLPARVSVLAYNHNHIHVPTFRGRSLNRILELLMFFEIGVTPFSGTLNHIIGHHQTYFDPENDTLNWRRADGSRRSGLEFAWWAMRGHYTSCFRIGRVHRIGSSFRMYFFTSFALLALLVWYQPVAALIVFVVPMAMMLFLLKYSAYSHHSGLEIGDDFTASRTNTGAFYNWLTWNAGYHAAHHLKQALHWSKLPQYHQKVAGRMPAELQGPGWGEDFARRKRSQLN